MAKKKKDEIESNGPAEPTALELELAKLPSTDKAAVIMPVSYTHLTLPTKA